MRTRAKKLSKKMPTTFAIVAILVLSFWVCFDSLRSIMNRESAEDKDPFKDL